MFKLRPTLLAFSLSVLLGFSCGTENSSQVVENNNVTQAGLAKLEDQAEYPGAQLAEGMGEVQVNVNLRDSGEPVEGILVRMLWKTDRNDTGRVFRKTNAQGFCSFEVEGGTVISSLSVEPTGATAPAGLPIERPLIPGQIAKFNFKLVPGGILSGMVIGADGEAVPNAKLKVWYMEQGELERNPDESVDAKSEVGADGVFTLGGMPAGDFVLTAEADGMVCVQRVGGKIKEAQVLDGFELFLEPSNDLMGMVRSSDDQPVENVLLVAGMVGRHAKRKETHHQACYYYPAQQSILYSKSDGSFVVKNVPSSQVWVLEAKHKLYQNVRHRLLPGETMADLELQGGMALAGIIVDAEGNAVSKARVLLSGEQQRERRCQRNGKFVFNALVEDWDASLAVHKTGFAPAYMTALKIDPDSQTLQIQLNKGTMLTGKVVDESGAGVSGLRISALDQPGLAAFGLNSTVSGPDGGFYLPDLAAEQSSWMVTGASGELVRFKWQPSDGEITISVAK